MNERARKRANALRHLAQAIWLGQDRRAYQVLEERRREAESLATVYEKAAYETSVADDVAESDAMKEAIKLRDGVRYATRLRMLCEERL